MSHSENPTDKLYAHTCKICGQGTDGIAEQMEAGPHWGRLNCSFCGAFLKWIPKPSEGKMPARKRNQKLVAQSGKDYCEVCLLKLDELTGNEVLEAHHVAEVELHNGTDAAHNIWIVCSSCHALIHHQRRYRGRVYDGRKEDTGATKEA